MIQGRACNYIAPLETEENAWSGLYVHDPEQEGAARTNALYLPPGTSQQERSICEELLIDIQRELLEHNRYVRDFKQICQIPDDQLQEAAFVITEKENPSTAGTRTYTAHNLSEVSVIMPEEIGGREIVLRKRDGGMKHMKDVHRAADHLSFVLLGSVL